MKTAPLASGIEGRDVAVFPCEVQCAVQEGMIVVRELTSAEIREINQHKYFMSLECGHDVGFEAAKEDWLANHAQAWHAKREAEMLEMERQEISRHVWIESEKAHRDVRRQASLEWVLKYAARWREWYEREFRGRKT